MKQQDSGDLSHTDIHSHLYLEETGACDASEGSECLAKGKVTNVRIFREINIVRKFSVLSLDPQTADCRKISTHYWINMT